MTAAGSAFAVGWWITANDSLTDPPYGWNADAGWSKKNYTNFWVDDGCTYKLVSAGAVNPHVTPKAGYGPHLGSSLLIH